MESNPNVDAQFDVLPPVYAHGVLLRAQIKSRPGLSTRIAEVVSAELRKHGIVVDEALLRELTIASSTELDIGRGHVIF